MKKLITWLLALAVMLTFLPAALANTGASATSAGLDIVVLIDRSGTMPATDPDNIAINATHQLIDRCDSNFNTVNVIFFGYDILWESGFRSLSTGGDVTTLHNDLNNQIDNPGYVVDGGEDTNTGRALEYAYEVISNHSAANPDRDFVILLLSDGQIDIGDSRAYHSAVAAGIAGDPALETQKSRDTALNIANQCAASGIPIYCLGIFSQSSNLLTDEMSSWANITGDGSGDNYQITDNINDVPGIIRRMYLSMTGNPDGTNVVLTNNEGTFEIPSNVLEANIEITPAVDENLITLKDSGGNPVTISGSNSVDIRKDPTGNYTILKLKKPAQGAWTISFADGIDHTISVAVTYNLDLKLELSSAPTVANNTTLTLNLAVTKQNIPFVDMLQTATVTITDPNGVPTVLTMNLNGDRYTCDFTPSAIGTYTASASMDHNGLSNVSNEITFQVLQRSLGKNRDLDPVIFSGQIVEKYTPFTLPNLNTYFSDPDNVGIASYNVELSDHTYVAVTPDPVNHTLTFAPLEATPAGAPVTVTVTAIDNNGGVSEVITGTITIEDAQQPIQTNLNNIPEPIVLTEMLPQTEGTVALTDLSSYFMEPNQVDGETVTVSYANEVVVPGQDPILRAEVINNELVLYGLEEGATQVAITGVSSDGTSIDLVVDVTVKNLMSTIIIIIIAAAIALILIAVIIIVIVLRNKPTFRSGSSLTVALYGDSESEGTDMMFKYRKRTVKLSEICRKAGMLTGQFGSYLDKVTISPRKKSGILVRCSIKGIKQKEITLRPYDAREIEVDPNNGLIIKLEYYENDSY